MHDLMNPFEFTIWFEICPTVYLTSRLLVAFSFSLQLVLFILMLEQKILPIFMLKNQVLDSR